VYWILAPFALVTFIAGAMTFFYARTMAATAHRAIFKIDVIQSPVLINIRQTSALLYEAEAHGFGQ
jgi:hypothetical protein